MAGEGSKDEKATHEPPAGAETTGTWTAADVSIDYTASATCIVLRKKEKPAAEIFSAAYIAEDRVDRPVMFVFNSGPGVFGVSAHGRRWTGARRFPCRGHSPADAAPARFE